MRDHASQSSLGGLGSGLKFIGLSGYLVIFIIFTLSDQLSINDQLSIASFQTVSRNTARSSCPYIKVTCSGRREKRYFCLISATVSRLWLS